MPICRPRPFPLSSRRLLSQVLAVLHDTVLHGLLQQHGSLLPALPRASRDSRAVMTIVIVQSNLERRQFRNGKGNASRIASRIVRLQAPHRFSRSLLQDYFIERMRKRRPRARTSTFCSAAAITIAPFWRRESGASISTQETSTMLFGGVN